jgi:hypothetical protein
VSRAAVAQKGREQSSGCADAGPESDVRSLLTLELLGEGVEPLLGLGLYFHRVERDEGAVIPSGKLGLHVGRHRPERRKRRDLGLDLGEHLVRGDGPAEEPFAPVDALAVLARFLEPTDDRDSNMGCQRRHISLLWPKPSIRMAVGTAAAP